MVYPILIFTLPLLLGFLMDRALGDPMRLGHPIVFFGRLIGFGEKHLNNGTSRRLKGFLYNGSLVCLLSSSRSSPLPSSCLVLRSTTIWETSTSGTSSS